MSPGDEVMVTIDGRRVRGHVLYVRGDSVRVELPGGSVTRPMSKVKPVRIKALAPTIMQFANAAVSAGTMDADGYIEAMRTGTIPVDDYEAHKHLNAVFFPPSADEVEALKAKIAEHIEIDRMLRPVPKPPKPDRNASYLAWIRLRHCCVCHRSGPIEAHHFGPRGTGQKCSDYLTVPLCTSCHREFHDTGKCRSGTPEETRETFLNAQRECMSLWVEEQLHEDVVEIVVAALLAHIREASGL